MRRIAVLVKQVPASPDRPMTATGRLDRTAASEMNPHCRRAVAKAAELAGAEDELVVLTMGPPEAVAVLVEALTFADRVTDKVRGVLITDPRLAGADTLVTARALASAIELFGPFDLVMGGRGSSDSDTGQVTAQVAELLGLPLVGAVRQLRVDDDVVRARCEHDDGWYTAEVRSPVVIACAERLCAPCKIPPEQLDHATVGRITSVTVDELRLSEQDLTSPTRVLGVAPHRSDRGARVLVGSDPAHVAELTNVILAGVQPATETTAAPQYSHAAPPVSPTDVTLLLAQHDRQALLAELITIANRCRPGTRVVVASTVPHEEDPVAPDGGDETLWLRGAHSAEAVAATLAHHFAGAPPAVFLASATTWGREVAARYGARIGAGVTADAIAVEVRGDRIVGLKGSPDGSMAHIVSDSATQIVSISPGVVTGHAPPQVPVTPVEHVVDTTMGDRVRYVLGEADSDAHAMLSADVVIGIGRGVDVVDMPMVTELARVLGAQIGASRAVTDTHVLPVSRQIGITGRSIAPALYVAIGIAGKSTHMLGVRRAGTVIAINIDAAAPVFGECDLGIVADWRDIAKALVQQANQRMVATIDAGG